MVRRVIMFVRRIKRRNGKVSVVLVEGYRINGKVKQRMVEYLGTESDLIKDDPEAINKLVAKYKTKQAQTDAFVKLVLRLNQNIAEQNSIRNYGYFYLERMYEELGLSELCQQIQKEQRVKYDLNHCLKLLCFMRALNPCSKKSSLEQGFDFFVEDYNLKLEQIYRSLTILKRYKADFVTTMHSALCNSYQRKTDILYYDVTNYFFEIDEEDSFRRRGCSKEYRPLPIIQMGMFIDNQGLPVDFYLYEGNHPDCTTLRPSFSQIKKSYGAEKVIITADKGLNSGSNIGYLLSENNGYILSQRIRGASKDLKAIVLAGEGWKTDFAERFKLKEFTRSIKVTYPDGSVHKHQQKVIAIWSEKYQHKEKATRDSLLELVSQLAKDPSKFKQSCHKGMKKYIDEIAIDKRTGEKTNAVCITTVLNQKKIAEDEELDGYYLIVTSEIELSATEIIEKYRGLWRIEEAFRITKADLKSRPIFVRTREHIEAHFLTCFIALTLLKMLEIRLKHRYSSRKIVDGLKSAVAIEISKNIYEINRREEVLDILDIMYQAKLGNRYVKAEQLRQYHARILDLVYTTP